MMAKLLYFPVEMDEVAVWGQAQRAAAGLGYIGQRGNGNVAALLAGIAAGEVAAVALAGEPRDVVIAWLRQRRPGDAALAAALTAIADALEEARQRGS